jgi:hypothetical protein
MAIETCKHCRGTKEVLKLGMMKGPCKACDAKGFMAVDKAKPVEKAKPAEKAMIKKKAKPKFPLLKDETVHGEDPEPQAA